MKNSKIIFPALLLIGVCLAGCHAKSQEASSPQQVQRQKQKMDSIQKIVTATHERYKAMDNPTLLKNLADQSKRQKEPFNSLAYRELKTRKDVNPDTLVALIHNLKEGDALLPLLLLRTLNQKSYTALPVELRTTILTGALQQSKTFNVWGLPGFYQEDASKALIECGQSALPALHRLLADTSTALLYGSKEYMIYMRYKLRRCDYALFFIEQIQGNKTFVMPVSAADRDALIRKI